MARLPFPKTLLEMQQMFPSEEDCVVYMQDVRWPDGFTCASCGTIGEPQRLATRTRVMRCRSCREETSVTAGTILHATRTPLQVWFWAAYLMVTPTPGISALQFQRQLGIGRYETAFQMLHKLRAGMVRPDRERIGGEWHVEVDETYIGGTTRGEGRGVHHKATVLGAVEVRVSTKRPERRERRRETHEGGIPTKGRRYAGRIRLEVVPNRRARTIESFVEENIESGSVVITDGWTGYDDLEEMGYKHERVVLRDDPELAAKHLPMIHLIFSNLKTWIMGTHHGVSQQHLQAYLNEYVFRFNRRFYPFTAFNSILGLATHAEGPTYKTLYSGEWQHPNPDGLSIG